MFVRGKRVEAQRLPRARPVPAPKSYACSCRWPVLPPSLPLSIYLSLHPAGPAGGRWRCRCLLSCLRPLCRSPAPAYSAVAASGPARPSPTQLKSGERGQERGEEVPSYVKQLPVACFDGSRTWGCDSIGSILVSQLGQRKCEAKETTVSGAIHKSSPLGPPKGPAVTSGICLTLTRSQLAHGEMKKTQPKRG